MVSLIVLIAAGLLTSSTAVAYVPQPPADAGAGAKLRRRFKNHFLVQVSAGLALGSILVAVNVQLDALR